MIDPGRPRIIFQWIDPCPNERLRLAQQRLLESVQALGLEPALFRAGPEMIKFGDILRHARRESVGTSFVWCHSDVLLTKNPFLLADRGKVVGFHRRELPSGEICGGVDMYLIPNLIWDNYLSRDIPDLWCGGTHVDWWLTRAASLIGAYESHGGYIDHLPIRNRPHPSAPTTSIFAITCVNIMPGPSGTELACSNCRPACP